MAIITTPQINECYETVLKAFLALTRETNDFVDVLKVSTQRTFRPDRDPAAQGSLERARAQRGGASGRRYGGGAVRDSSEDITETIEYSDQQLKEAIRQWVRNKDPQKRDDLLRDPGSPTTKKLMIGAILYILQHTPNPKTGRKHFFPLKNQPCYREFRDVIDEWDRNLFNAGSKDIAADAEGATAVFLAGSQTVAEQIADLRRKDPQKILDREQQFLVRNMKAIAAKNFHRFGGGGSQGSYKNFLTIYGEPYKALARLHASSAMRPFFEITPAQHALLEPKIKLFKVIMAQDNRGVETERELVFKAHTTNATIERIFTTKSGRGDGVGIKNLTIDYLGEQEAEAKKIMEVKLSLHCQNFESLFDAAHLDVIRGGGPLPSTPAFIDLIWRVVDPHLTGLPRGADPAAYQLKLVAGWAVPPNIDDDVFPVSLREAIKKTTVSLYLHLLDHQFKFNQNGTLDVEIVYRARVETLAAGPLSDIFADTEKRIAKKHVQKEIGVWKGLKAHPEASPADKKKAQEHITTLEKQLISTGEEQSLKVRYSQVMGGLMQAPIQYIDPYWTDYINLSSTTDFAVGSSETDTDAAYEQFKEIVTQLQEGFINDPTKDPQNNWVAAQEHFGDRYRINYFYLGDLMETLIQNVRKGNPEAFKNTQFLVSSFVYKDASGRKQILPLANIPISLNFFNDWFMEHVVAIHKSHYYLLNFLRDFMTAIAKACGTDFGWTPTPSRSYGVQFSMSTKSFPKDKNGVDAIMRNSHGGGPLATQYKQKYPNAEAKINTKLKNSPAYGGQAHVVPYISIAGIEKATWGGGDVPDLSPHGATDYIILYASTIDITAREGRIDDDFADGIYHLGLGQSNGIVKKIDFKMQQMAGQPEANATQEEVAMGQLIRKYNASVSTIGNFLFFPGTQLFINPSIPGFASPSTNGAVLRKFGLGGYFRVIRVNSQITSRSFTTNLECVWVGAGKGSAGIPKPTLTPGAS